MWLPLFAIPTPMNRAVRRPIPVSSQRGQCRFGLGVCPVSYSGVIVSCIFLNPYQ